MGRHVRESHAVSSSAWGKGAGLALLAFALVLVGVGSASAATINLTVAGPGAGTVSSSPGLIACTTEGGVQAGTCSGSFADGLSVKMTATPKPGSVFEGWITGASGCTGLATFSDDRTPCTVAANGTITLAAKFIPTPSAPRALSGIPSVGVTDYLRVLHGEVDPEGFRVDECRFEYGVTTAYGQAIPCSPSPAALGIGSAKPVSAETEPLDPNRTYHYRLFAAGLGGAHEGEDRTFTTGSIPDFCPSATSRERRAEQGIFSILLPTCMALEQVSPPQKDSQPAASPAVSASGDRIRFISGAALGGSPGVLTETGDPYVASRAASGWVTSFTRPPAELNRGWFGVSKSFSPDLSHWLQIVATASQSDIGAGQAFDVGLDGSLSPLGPLMTPLVGGTPKTLGSSVFQGASANHSHLVFSVKTLTYASGDPVPSGSAAESNAYIAHRDPGREPDLDLLASDEVGPNKAWGGNCGASLGGPASTRGAISSDGLRSYITTRPAQAPTGFCQAANRLRIMVREENSSGAADISELVSNECDRVSPACSTADGDDLYLGASLDQTKVYFATTRQLVDTDLDATPDVYIYDTTKTAGSRLTQATAGGTGDATPGSAANVSGLAALSGDGTHAYFVSTDVLTTDPDPALPAGQQVATAGQPNLYLYEYPTGRTAFVATLTPGGGEGAYPVPLVGSNPTVGGDGHVLLFNSKASLMASDADGGFRDVFRYDATQPPAIACVSCRLGGPDAEHFDVAARGGPGGGSTDFAETGRWASEDGNTVILQSAESLVPGDNNHVTDSYLWKEGSLYRLPGTADVNGNLGDNPVLSHDGGEVAFQSAAKLLPTDGDDAKDIYVARIGGGFEFPSTPPPCVDENCQKPFAALPGSVGIPSEAAGPGNPAPCPKGRRRAASGRCVAQARKHRKHKQHKKAQKRAKNTSGRAGR